MSPEMPWYARPADMLVDSPSLNGHAHRGVNALQAPRQLDSAPATENWPVARELASRVSDQLAEMVRSRSEEGGGFTEAARRELGRSLIESVLRDWLVTQAEQGSPVPSKREEWLRQGVFWTVFGLGPLEPLLAEEGIENIIIVGDRVQLQYADGRLVEQNGLTSSHDELIELLNRAGTVFGSAERSLSPASPHFRMSLPNGSRLAALAYVTPEPQAVIRRHRTSEWRLEEFVTRGMISQSLRQFLLALLRARKNILVVGPQDAGKTSLLRALLRELSPGERPAMIETEGELRLQDFPADHPWVLPMEARPGSREDGGHGMGRVTLTDLVEYSLGQATTRLVVGEVLGAEIIPMLNAMMAGSQGSMCTLHAKNSRDAFDRVTVLCQQAQPNMVASNAYRLAAVAVDYVVVVNSIDERQIGGRKHRFVAEVGHVTGVGENGLPDLDLVYHRGPDGRAIPAGLTTDLLELRRAGFDPGWLTAEQGGWAAPMDLLVWA